MYLYKSLPSVLICFAFSIVLFFSSCSENNGGIKIDGDSKVDSIPIWINQTKIHHISEVDKLSLFHKALRKVKKTANDSLKASYLTTLSYGFSKTSDSLTFKQVNQLAFGLANKLKDTTKLANLHWDLGSFYDHQTILKDSAFYHFTTAEKLFTKLGDLKSSGFLHTNLAWLQNNIGDYTGSNTTVIKAIEKLKPLSEFSLLQRCYAILGDNAKLLNEFDRSLEYYNESLIYNKKSGANKIVEIGIKNGIGLVYQKNQNHEQAINYFKEVLSLDSLQYTNTKLYGKVLNNLGYSYLNSKNTSEIPFLFNEAIAIQESIGDVSGQSSTTNSLAEYYLFKKDTAQALKQLQKAKTLAIQSNNKKRLLEILRMFPRVDPKNASKHTKEYLVLNDSLLLEERQLRNKFARIQFETDEFIAENEHLEKQKQLWAGIAITMLLLGLMTFIIANQRVKNQKLRFEKQQQANNYEIFNLLLSQKEKVAEAKKLEQKRVSEELHDGVLGKMLGARMMLIGLNKKNTPEAIAERAKAISMLQKVEQEVRSISHELSHAAYQKIDNFIRSIKDILTTIENTSNIKFTFSYADNLDYDALNGNIKINLYRILQECFQNAVKHANCNQINLSFALKEKQLKVEITDNGIGFAVKKGKKGIGTRNINSRIKKIKGSWNIQSSIGKGTTVSLLIPIVTHDNSTSITIERDAFQEF